MPTGLTRTFPAGGDFFAANSRFSRILTIFNKGTQYGQQPTNFPTPGEIWGNQDARRKESRVVFTTLKWYFYHFRGVHFRCRWRSGGGAFRPKSFPNSPVRAEWGLLRSPEASEGARLLMSFDGPGKVRKNRDFPEILGPRPEQNKTHPVCSSVTPTSD